MLQNVTYEAKDMNELFVVIADEIKNGWKLCGFSMPNIECSLCLKPDITMEVSFYKEMKI